ncbi:PREDICTED: mediator of RNA polymerase II transcription subunit 34 [Tarenaya hassleriana]|uniref:mediator of RNA polymerase II transcription subunit 34 n=1 Tax=Tarenaya hassleriana TaxID=28532 RepID=UPI00053C2B83|nr:PREDICTED: mediator of RNA polymerase II transcription subunit 34 [Tarenaya hassleriana]
MENEAILDELQSLDSEIEDIQGQISALIEQQDRLYERKSELKALLEALTTSGSPVNDSASNAVENWSGPFEWDSRADDIRFNIFGISSYRANQREIINAIMAGRDVLVIMAAGGGKSLCYQLPAILRGGTTLVVSPLLSLIQDQVMGLAALGIPAFMLTSTTSKENEKFVYKALEKGEEDLKILYVTPEKISKSKRFMSKLEKCHHAGRLSLISIDEAHCCSQWGHDFRPDYKNLSILKTQFPKVPMVALTATATHKVQNDLTEMLHIPKCVKFVSSVNRPNLFYSVREKSSVGKVVVDEIAELIRESYPNGESGIVYCFSRKECEQVAGELRERGISADYYHADVDVNAREKVHTRWTKNKLQVIVGTVAFGMGINKPDVRFVIHHSLSKSMETYYQESGRAGRDGLPSECVLFFRPADVPRQSSMVFYEYSGLQNLYDIVRYCQTKRKCRRSAFFRHFGEALQECNGVCDNCAFSSEVKEVDVSGPAKLVVSLVQETQQKDQRATMLQLVDKLRSMHKGLGAELNKEQIEHLVIQLIITSVLKEEFQHTAYSTNAYVTLGPLAKQVLQGRKIIKMEVSSRQNNSTASRKSKRRVSFSGLELKLDELRKEISSAQGSILPHAVLSTQQMSSISFHKPSSLQELESAIGKLKTEKYGDRILEVVMKYDAASSEENETKEETGTKTRPRKRQKKTDDDSVVLVGSSDDEEA